MQWKWKACYTNGLGAVLPLSFFACLLMWRERGGGPTLQIPHATVHSSLTALAWFAWHSMPASLLAQARPRTPKGPQGTASPSCRWGKELGGSRQRSMMWLRQMAQFSTTISHDQRATAFHCIRFAQQLAAMCCAEEAGDDGLHLLDFEPRLLSCGGGSLGCGGLGARCCGNVFHVYVCHGRGSLCDGGGGGDASSVLRRRGSLPLR